MNLIGAPVAATAESAPPPRGGAVEFGDEDGADWGGFVEGFRLSQCLLPDGAVDDHHDFVGVNVFLEVFHFFDEFFFFFVAPRSVHDDYVFVGELFEPLH